MDIVVDLIRLIIQEKGIFSLFVIVFLLTAPIIIISCISYYYNNRRNNDRLNFKYSDLENKLKLILQIVERIELILKGDYDQKGIIHKVKELEKKIYNS